MEYLTGNLSIIFRQIRDKTIIVISDHVNLVCSVEPLKTVLPPQVMMMEVVVVVVET